MNVNRILHLYWRTKRKRVHKKNLTRFCKVMFEQGKKGAVR